MMASRFGWRCDRGMLDFAQCSARIALLNERDLTDHATALAEGFLDALEQQISAMRVC